MFFLFFLFARLGRTLTGAMQVTSERIRAKQEMQEPF